MKLFNAIRGSHFRGEVTVGSSGSISLSGLSSISADNALITNFSIQIGQRVHPISCFADYTYVFAFGHAPELSRYSITLSVFLVSKGECKSSGYVAGGALKNLKNLYDEWKVSNKRALATIIAGGVSLQGALAGMTIVGENPELNMVSVRFDLLGVKD